MIFKFFLNVASTRKAVVISVLNQGFSSATNFLFGVYLVRSMVQEEFGLYGIGIAISLFIAGLGNSIFLTQMVVNYGDRQVTEKTPYLARMFAGVVVFCLLICFLSCIGIEVSTVFIALDKDQTSLFYATLVASFGFLLKDFFVRQAYTEQYESKALIVNIAVTIALFIATTYQYIFHAEINSSYALNLYGASNFFGAVIGLCLANFNKEDLIFKKIKDDIKEAWLGGGGWYVLVTCANSIQTQAHTIVGAMLLGPIGVATMNAARLLLVPPLLLLPALNQVFLPRMVEVKREKKSDSSSIGWKISMAMVSASFLYMALIIPMIDWLAEVIFKNKYEDLKITTYGWCFAVSLIALRSGFALENHANKEFKKFFLATLIAGTASVIFSWAFIKLMGPVGGPLGLGFGDLLLAIFLITKIRL